MKYSELENCSKKEVIADFGEMGKGIRYGKIMIQENCLQ